MPLLAPLSSLEGIKGPTLISPRDGSGRVRDHSISWIDAGVMWAVPPPREVSEVCCEVQRQEQVEGIWLQLHVTGWLQESGCMLRRVDIALRLWA